MPRYDEMDTLLHGVRERLVAKPEPSRVEAPVVHGTLTRDDTYASLIEAMMVVFRDAQQLQELVTTQQMEALSSDQRDEMLSLLGLVRKKLAGCEAEIERAVSC